MFSVIQKWIWTDNASQNLVNHLILQKCNSKVPAASQQNADETDGTNDVVEQR